MSCSALIFSVLLPRLPSMTSPFSSPFLTHLVSFSCLLRLSRILFTRLALISSDLLAFTYFSLAFSWIIRRNKASRLFHHACSLRLSFRRHELINTKYIKCNTMLSLNKKTSPGVLCSFHYHIKHALICTILILIIIKVHSFRASSHCLLGKSPFHFCLTFFTFRILRLHCIIFQCESSHVPYTKPYEDWRSTNRYTDLFKVLRILPHGSLLSRTIPINFFTFKWSVLFQQKRARLITNFL